MTMKFAAGQEVQVVPLAGVAADFRPTERLLALAEAAASDPRQVSRALEASGFLDACARGEFDRDAMIGAVRRHLGADLTEAHLLGLWSLAYEPRLERLERLAADRERRVLLVEDGPLLAAGFDAYLPEIHQAFPHRVSTHELGVRPREPDCFAALGAYLEVPVQRLSLLTCPEVAPELVTAARAAEVVIRALE